MDKRTAILSTTLRLFTTQGFRATSTAQIAREAGVGNGTLFHYFASKEELIETLFLKCSVEADEYVRKDLDKHKSIKEVFLQLFRNWLDFALEYPEKYLYINQYLTSSYISRQEARALFSEFTEKIIIPGERKKVFKNSPPDLILDIICYLLHAVIIHFLENRHKADDPVYVDQALSFIWDSVRDSASVFSRN